MAPRVLQDEFVDEDSTEVAGLFELTSQLNIIFGFLDGALNALPKGSSLGNCA